MINIQSNELGLAATMIFIALGVFKELILIVLMLTAIGYMS